MKFQASLRDAVFIVPGFPGVETRGYFRVRLRRLVETHLSICSIPVLFNTPLFKLPPFNPLFFNALFDLLFHRLESMHVF